jgi:hypothetical protein
MYSRATTGYFNRCKICDRERAKESMARSRAADPEAHRQKRAMWSRTARLRQYGITEDDYSALCAKQDGRCAICGSAEAGGWGGQLPVDHDHETGRVRGLLCNGCNSGLGRFGDDPDRLLAAAAYLLSWQNVLGQVF